jgi:single-strand DNA-binding protein
MAGSVNKVILLGRIGRDPEYHDTQSGGTIVNLSLATSERWKDKNTGERKENTTWHRVVIFNDKLAEVAQKYVRKGSLIYVEGQLATRKWTDKNNQERYTTEVVIPRFGGVLTLLSDGQGGREPGQDGDGSAEDGGVYGDSSAKPSSYASGRPQSGGASRFGGQPATGGGRSYGADAPKRDLDDDIPF